MEVSARDWGYIVRELGGQAFTVTVRNVRGGLQEGKRRIATGKVFRALMKYRLISKVDLEVHA